jgi:hypothetical protein
VTWLLIAFPSAIAVFLAFGLFIAGVLGRIGREISGIVEDEERELWATVPLARETRERSRVTAPKRERSRSGVLVIG